MQEVSTLTFVADIQQLHVEPTTVCQAECPMCIRTILGYHNRTMENKELSFNQFKTLVSPLLSNLNKVLFCGSFGDPIACKDLRMMMLWMLQKNPRLVIGINTNGALGSTKLWTNIAYLFKSNLYNYVVFSLDGLEDTNNIYRKKVVWKKAMANAKAFIDAGGVAHWEMIVFKHNEHQIDEAKQLAEDMGFRVFRTKATSRFDHNPNTGLEPPTNHSFEMKDKEFACHAEEQKSVYLSAEGIWYPCCFTHVSTETSVSWLFDDQWGDPIVNINDRSTKWYNLEKNILSRNLDTVCHRACATTAFSGQWTTEQYFS